MSNRAWGVIRLDSDNAKHYPTLDVAYLIVDCATKNRVGIKLGWNISECYIKLFKENYGTNMKRNIPFELLDDPTTNVAHLLFSGEGVIDFVDDNEISTPSVSLSERMQKVQNFLAGLLRHAAIKSIMLTVDGMYGIHPDMDLDVSEFKNTMISLIEENHYFAPHVTFNFTKPA